MNSGDEHSVHSPYIYNFYTKVIRASSEKISAIEVTRKNLSKSRKVIHVTDLGAGSKLTNQTNRSIAEIVKNSSKSPRLASLINRIISFQNPDCVFDLGTSLGFTTGYIAKAIPNGKIISFEGAPEIAKVASENFNTWNCNNIEIVIGNIDEKLEEALSDHTPQIVFFDANHRYAPTIKYFHTCLSKADRDTIFIFDDIYWSSEMEKAWMEIKEHSQVKVTIDLFHLGLVFFREGQEKEHFKLKL